MGYCGTCKHLTKRHNCAKYNKHLTHSSYDVQSLAYIDHERCAECEKDYYIKELQSRIERFSNLCYVKGRCKGICYLCDDMKIDGLRMRIGRDQP